MSGRRLVVTLLASCALIGGSTRPVFAATWSEAFAADSDTVVFLGARGAVMRGPFHRASVETLWAPRGEEHVVRVRVSPDGRSVAWLTRAGEQDTTRLWTAGAAGRRAVPVRFFALQPGAYGVLHYEPGIPSLEDADVRGARFVRPAVAQRRLSSHTLEWTPDSRAVVFGYNDGLALAPADEGPAVELSRALAVRLRMLDPAPFFLLDALAVRDRVEDVGVGPAGEAGGVSRPILVDGRERVGGEGSVRRRSTERTSYLLYPLPHRWRLYPASGLDVSRRWVASEDVVWWAEGRKIRAVRSDDPRVVDVLEAPRAVEWLGWHPASRQLSWVAGSTVSSRSAAGGEVVERFRVEGPVRSVIESNEGRRVAIVADRLTVWDPAGLDRVSVPRPAADPTLFVEAPDGTTLFGWEAGRGRSAGLARLDAARSTLVPIELPALKNGQFAVASHGGKIVWFAAGAEPPASFHVYDVAANAWSVVDNPGLAGWEPLSPR